MVSSDIVYYVPDPICIFGVCGAQHVKYMFQKVEDFAPMLDGSSWLGCQDSLVMGVVCI